MWTKLTALLLLLAVATAVSADEPKRKCVDGKSYYNGCCTCVCVSGYTGCTLMGCSRLDPKTGKIVTAKILPPPEDYWVA